MKVNSVNKQQNFKGSFGEKTVGFITKHPALLATLAGSSVIAQKVVMSSSEATIGPAMDIAIGKTISKITNEKDGRTKQSSKVQAVRTFSQAVGGTIVGVIIRGICIAGATALCMKAGGKIGEELGKKFPDKFASIVNNGLTKKSSDYEKISNASAWGKNIGGAVALMVMLVTNFLIDAPFINLINKNATKVVKNIGVKFKKPQEDKNSKEVK